jgi:hypothetical protein
MVNALRPHSLSFDAARVILNEWALQEPLADGGWDTAWEDLCEVEVDRWTHGK